MTSLSALPDIRIEDLPIPDDAKAHSAWPASMLEMAAHIGAYATLQLVDRFGGKELYVPMQAADWHVSKLIGGEKASKLCAIYGRERLPIPVARSTIFCAKSAPVFAAVLSGQMSLTEGAHILRTSRSYLSHRVNAERKGLGHTEVLKLVAQRGTQSGQFEMFPGHDSEMRSTNTAIPEPGVEESAPKN